MRFPFCFPFFVNFLSEALQHLGELVYWDVSLKSIGEGGPMRNWLKRYPLAKIPLCYFTLFYLPGFFLLERLVVPKYTIHCFLDDWIPFCEYFLIPYALWFPLLAGSLLYFLLKSDQDFLRLCFLMFVGMAICLLIYWILPNGLDLRPEIQRDNLFCRLMQFTYTVDTPTNVCPSIHVSSTTAIHWVVWHSPLLKNRRWIRWGSGVLTVLICLSTVFLKQHSVVDVACGILLTAVLIPVESLLRRRLARKQLVVE